MAKRKKYTKRNDAPKPLPHGHYAYIHYLRGTNMAFYVGKGSTNRAWSTSNRSDGWYLFTGKYQYDIKIISWGLTADAAYDIETELIEKIGIENLVNVSTGGRGTRGVNHSDETKDRIRMTLLNIPKTEEHKLNMSKAKQNNNYAGKLILNTDTNIFYDNCRLAADSTDKYTYSMLSNRLRGSTKNDSNFIYA